MRPIDAENALHWSRHLEALRAGVRNRSPDGPDRIRREIKRLERELGPLASTLSVIEAKHRTGQPVDLGRGEAIRARFAALQSQVADLRAIMRNVKATPHKEDRGPTSEVAARATIASDIPEDLHGPAMDLRCGWMVRTSGLSAAISSYDELRVSGQAGQVAERLERAYVTWRATMAHSRLLVWPTELVVCEGRSLLESARLRNMDPRIIGHHVASGLIVYGDVIAARR
jgi:hypothetical protein